MRVLMFGWEFPPHIAGGLGTACYGMTRGLAQHGVKVIFVMPKAYGDEDQQFVRVVNASDVETLYGDPKQDRHLREVSVEEAEKITFFLYEELLAFKRAAKTLGLSRQDIEDIMYNNAHDLIEGARKSIYG